MLKKQQVPAGRVITPEQMIRRLLKVARFIEGRIKKRVVKDHDKHYLKVEIPVKYVGLVKFFRKVYKKIIAEMADKPNVKVYYNKGFNSENMGYEVQTLKGLNKLTIYLGKTEEVYYIHIRAYDERAGL